MEMPPTVLKLKGEKMFSETLYMFRQTLCRLSASCLFHLPFPSFGDAAEAQIYSASTVFFPHALELHIRILFLTRGQYNSLKMFLMFLLSE
jgi:hypothetical protein